VRWRSIVHVLSLALFGQSLPLPDFPQRPDILGVGLSDWEGYAVPLASRLAYTNTYLHRSPRLDITTVDGDLRGRFDFAVASDVFEHVPPPVSVAFRNLRSLLRPGGVAVFSAPYVKGDAHEHFPDLHRYELRGDAGSGWELHNTTASGETQVFHDLVFHGGPGSTLEMRVFSESALAAEFEAAGFRDVQVHSEQAPEWGILWTEDRSLPMSARA
jgi:SAM-dependent methyltransferase